MHRCGKKVSEREKFLKSLLYVKDMKPKIKTRRVARVSTNRRYLLIYLPKSITEALKLRKGDYVLLSVNDGNLIVKKINLEDQVPASTPEKPADPGRNHRGGSR
jgi:AbrB family looped-hinge helix DNA binding protein